MSQIGQGHSETIKSHVQFETDSSCAHIDKVIMEKTLKKDLNENNFLY